MVHWAHVPVALWNEHWYNAGGIFTGSATVVDGKPFILFPGIGCNSSIAPASSGPDPCHHGDEHWLRPGRARLHLQDEQPGPARRPAPLPRWRKIGQV